MIVCFSPVWIGGLYSIISGHKNSQTTLFICSHCKVWPSIINLIGFNTSKWIHPFYSAIRVKGCNYLACTCKNLLAEICHLHTQKYRTWVLANKSKQIKHYNQEVWLWDWKSKSKNPNATNLLVLVNNRHCVVMLKRWIVLFTGKILLLSCR